MTEENCNSTTITELDTYLNAFSDETQMKAAFNQVLDMRKFEIDLYWKRTTFFWTILGAILAGYFLVLSRIATNGSVSYKIIFSLGCLGLIFTVGWYFVNRGSKYWQVNWEKHLNILEDKIMGPLYKTTINKEYYFKRFWSLSAPYPFSVSKLNQVLNLILIAFWLILLLDFSLSNLHFSLSPDYIFSFYSIMGFFTFLSIVALYSLGHTSIDFKLYKYTYNKRRSTAINFEKRGID